MVCINRPDMCLAPACLPETIEPMKQSSLGLGTSTKRTRRREFLDEMDRVIPWSDLVAEIAPFMPEGKRGRPPFPVESLLRIHFMQQWFTLSDPSMEEALHDMPLFRDFAGLGGWDDRLPDESTILRFRHVLEKHKLAERILATVNLLLGAKGLMLRSGTVVDATLISAPSSTKNASGERDPEMHQSKKGQQWFFGMKAHIGWCTPCAARPDMSTMWSRPTACCTGKRQMSLPTRAIKVRTNGPTQRPVCSGMWPCDRACASCWTRLTRWMR
jgi:hypothetical protein